MGVTLPPFQALLDAHGRDVHRFLIATVGPVDAEDCYQETWLAALRAYPRLRDASNLRGWILTIAHHRAIDHLRGRARRPVPVPDVTEVTGVAQAAGLAQVTGVAQATGVIQTAGVARAAGVAQATGAAPDTPGLPDQALWAAVAALPDKQRAALALRFIGDCAYAEIGRAMGTSEAAARRSVHEGLTKLRKEHRP